eukprot:8479939-Alexandrium_andersonii.AAC.1
MDNAASGRTKRKCGAAVKAHAPIGQQACLSWGLGRGVWDASWGRAGIHIGVVGLWGCGAG